MLLLDTRGAAGGEVRQALERAVEALGGVWAIWSVSNFRAVAAAMRYALPQVLFFDLLGREPRAWEAARTERQCFPEAALIVATDGLDTRSLVSALCIGASGYLLKPLTTHQVKVALVRAARGLYTFPDAGEALLLTALHRAIRAADANLSPAEQKLMTCLLAGMRDKEISDCLRIGPGTVHTHLARIYKKFSVHDRRAALSKYLHI